MQTRRKSVPEPRHLILRRRDLLLQTRERDPRTVKGYRLAAESFENFCEERGIDPKDIQRPEIEEWAYSATGVRGNKLAPSVRNLYYIHVRAAYALAVDDDLLPKSPFKRAEAPRIPEKKPRIIPISRLKEMKQICLDSTNPTHGLLFYMYAYTGLRFFEGQRMRWEDLTATEHGWQFDFIGKGDKRRIVPIHPELQRLLKGERRDAGCIFPSDRGDYPWLTEAPLRKLCREITDGEFSFHDFRRTVASSMDANGAEEVAITKIMGWAEKTMFDRSYRSVAPERLHKAILRLYENDPL